MKFGVDAEKIVIYLTPFVLKINLKIIIYEFDTDSSVIVKDFNCGLQNKIDIILLYRKTHYDLVYSSKYFENYTKELTYFVNLDENLKVVDSILMDSLRNINISDNKNISIENSRNSIIDINKIVEFPKCLACKNDYLHKTNILNLCVICIGQDFNNQLMANYLEYLNEAVQQMCSDSKDFSLNGLYNDSKYTKKLIYI